MFWNRKKKEKPEWQHFELPDNMRVIDTLGLQDNDVSKLVKEVDISAVRGIIVHIPTSLGITKERRDKLENLVSKFIQRARSNAHPQVLVINDVCKLTFLMDYGEVRDD